MKIERSHHLFITAYNYAWNMLHLYLYTDERRLFPRDNNWDIPLYHPTYNALERIVW